MAKVVTIRERVHQPFWDTLIRTAGLSPGTLGDQTDLFINSSGRTLATTNLQNGSTLPSDQSFVVLALRCFTWFRNTILRVAGTPATTVATTGDYGTLLPWVTGAGQAAALGQSPGRVEDVYRLHWQVEEQLHWDFGTGQKNSITNIPTWYFPAGGGISGNMGAATDLIHWQNSGWDGHAGILRLARAILLPPRQNILCRGSIFSLNDEGQAGNFLTVQNNRNMLSLRDNLNTVDAIQKVVVFMFDGLFSRDVQ